MALSTTLGACSIGLDFDATTDKSGPFCAQHAAPSLVFCDDFDSAPRGTQWTENANSINGRIGSDSRAGFSGTTSLLSVANGVQAHERTRAVRTVTTPGLNAPFLRVSFMMRVDEFDRRIAANGTVFQFLYAAAEHDFNQIGLNLVSTGSAVSLRVSENEENMGELGGYEQYASGTQLRPGEWVKVCLALEVVRPRSTGNTLHVSLNGKKEPDIGLQLRLKTDAPDLELGVGWVDTTAATQAWEVRYDNFLVELVSLPCP